MTKHVRRPSGRKKSPGLQECLFHRCDRHKAVPMLNNEEETGSECGACLAELMLTYKAQLLLALDGYAARLIYCSMLRQKLEGARDRLNLLAPGAGDYLNEDTEDDDAERDS